MTDRDHRSRLRAIARKAMVLYGLEPDWPSDALRELARLDAPPHAGLRDLRTLPWSSIDNDDSRDLDQLEAVVDDGGRVRLLVAIADVDALVRPGGAIDAHARTNTTSVYTPAHIFPMLPEELSTDRTSLNPDTDRAAVVVDMTVGSDGAVGASECYRALVRSHAKLAYRSVAAWLDGTGPRPHAVRVAGLDDQIRRQDRVAALLRARREEDGALDFARTEMKPIMKGPAVQELRAEASDRARDMIESFMVAANGATARFLSSRGVPALRRVVRSPERWDRIVAVADRYGDRLPAAPDAAALERFLRRERAAHPDTFDDLSLTMLKLLGRGEYVAEGPGAGDGHFALAVSSYTHSTAPNRRFPDLVSQRLVKAALDRVAPPYGLDDLTTLAAHCTRQEDAANKVERLVRKAAAALWMSGRVGDTFDAVVTGASAKGTWVRLHNPAVEGKLERGFEGLDVGDTVRVQLESTDPERGFIDFARVR
jgi:exoribonuclease-2